MVVTEDFNSQPRKGTDFRVEAPVWQLLDFNSQPRKGTDGTI